MPVASIGAGVAPGARSGRAGPCIDLRSVQDGSGALLGRPIRPTRAKRRLASRRSSMSALRREPPRHCAARIIETKLRRGSHPRLNGPLSGAVFAHRSARNTSSKVVSVDLHGYLEWPRQNPTPSAGALALLADSKNLPRASGSLQPASLTSAESRERDENLIDGVPRLVVAVWPQVPVCVERLHG